MTYTHLSANQRFVLKQLVAGEELICAQNVLSTDCWYVGSDLIRIRSIGCQGLVKRRLIKAQPYKTGSFHTIYTITDAGRVMLREAQKEDKP